MRKFTLLLFSSLILFCTHAFSQLLSGKVMAESGMYAKKVSVSFLNNANKVETGADGSFKIFATKLPDTLVFSAPGYEPYKVVITEKNIKDPNFEVVLLNKRNDFAAYESYAGKSSLSEVVVTAGYGAKRSKRTTASSFADTPVEEALSGRVAGASVRSESFDYDNRSSFGKKLNLTDSISPKDSGLLKSQVLTAGEVNDFYKWKMWGDLSDNEFKTWSNHWGITATQRYTVQLHNKQFAAIVNQPVFLVNKKTNEKIWSAVTDNTGKAELWANFNSKTEGAEDYLITDGAGHNIASPVTFANGINHLQTDRSCEVSNQVDIAFVVDATGSMGDEIEFLKFELEDVIRKTFDHYTNLDLKAASVFYRDKGDEYVTKYLDFQSDLLKVLNFVKLQRQGGGGDEPEAVDSALDVALSKLSWRKEARTRLLFLFLDAPPHDYAKNDMARLIEKAAAMGIRIIPVACSGSGKSNEYLLRSMALATNGTYAFLTDHSGVGGKHTEASTDSYNVELLNNLLQRIIQQFVYVRRCAEADVKANEPEIKQPENLARVIVYPNPTHGNASIVSDKEIKESYIADFTGKLLLKLSGPVKGTWQVNIGNYPSGTYIIKYITADNKWGTEKLVLIH
jgi:hypothetical protein